MQGCFGKYVDINLSSETIQDYEIPAKWSERYLGGRGIGARILIDELRGKKIDDLLGEDNLLIISTGPLQGTGVAGSGRHAVIGISPKTRTLNESYSGGFWGHELGKSGYDGIIIRGKSKDPVYIFIEDEKVKIFNANSLWGLETAETEEELRKIHGKVKVSSIGPAGENLVKFSCIINDRNRAAGRPGFGAVMGSKNLKAIAIKGNMEKPIADPEQLKQLKGKFAKWLMEDPATQQLGKYGSSNGLVPLNELGILPTKNFQEGFFDGAEKLSGESLYDRILTKRDTCTGCPVRCKRVVKTEFNGEQVNEKYGGPEYETLAALGSFCLNDNLESIALANQKCNAYGLDTISAGVTIAFAMEASEKGLIDEEIKWGDPNVINVLLDKIAFREGIGDWLAQGIDKIAEEINADFAMHIKGQEIPMHEPRGKKGLAISYATSPRGATHLEAFHDTMIENLAKPIEELGIFKGADRFKLEQKAKPCKIFEDLFSFTDSLIICANISWSKVSGKYYPYNRIREILTAVTGQEISAEDMLLLGERNYALRKILTAKHGYTKENDDIPRRMKKSLPRGGSANEPIPNKAFQKEIDEYYRLRGFDEKGPTKGKLKELGIEELYNF